MQAKIVWQYGSSNPENGDNLQVVRQWWERFANKKVSWQQRLIPEGGDLEAIDWEAQRFDEEFVLISPSLRGITLYWRKPGSPEERNTTADRLELDTCRQKLYIFPQSQKQLVIRVGVPEVKYDKVLLKNPDVVVEGGAIAFRDNRQLVEVKISFSEEGFEELKKKLQGS
jgi:hypothetical protein